jgi:hypothetical protein
MNEPIPFIQLANFNDSNSFVWTSLEFNPAERADIEAFLKESGFIPATGKIIDMRLIAGNVLGSEGRTDVLFVTEPCQFNPLARLRLNGVKWTSDFIVNYAADYGQAPVDDDEDEDDYDEDDFDDEDDDGEF